MSGRGDWPTFLTVLAHECPQCNADPGERCVSRTGKRVVHHHLKRIHLACDRRDGKVGQGDVRAGGEP